MTITDNGQATGSLVASTAYYVTAIPGNRWGNCKVNANIDTLTTGVTVGDTYSIRATIAQCVGAEYYDMFLSVDAAPKWVARITEAQRAAGGFKVATYGAVTASAGVPAGKFDICVVGTGIQTTNAIFAQSNAFTPAASGITPIDSSCKQHARVLVKLALADLRSAPSLNIIPFLKNQASSGDWHQGTLQAVSVLGGTGQSLLQEFDLNIEGSAGLVVLVSSIVGQGAAASVWVELV